MCCVEAVIMKALNTNKNHTQYPLKMTAKEDAGRALCRERQERWPWQQSEEKRGLAKVWGPP